MQEKEKGTAAKQERSALEERCHGSEGKDIMFEKKASARGAQLAVLVASQLFSLFAAEILQFVLPLHLLSISHSGSLYGAVVAAGFIPYTLLVPVGGILADRTRKRSVMAACDAVLAVAMMVYLLLEGTADPVGITIVVLMLAFAAQALVQPCVQSAVPFLVEEKQLPRATAVVNQVSMITGIAGPVVGGLVYGLCGMAPVVVLSAAAFAVSCALVLGCLRVPYTPPVMRATMLATVRGDLGEAARFVSRGAAVRSVVVSATLVNLFGAAFLTVGTPYVVSIVFGMPQQYVGFAQAALAVGGLAGGAIVAAKGGFSVRVAARGMFFVALGLAGVAVVLLGASALSLPMAAAYVAVLVCYVFTFASCMVYSISAMTHIQLNTPEALLGKVIAFVMMLANFATPAGQLVYGVGFDHCPAWALAAIAAMAVLAIAVATQRKLAHIAA